VTGADRLRDLMERAVARHFTNVDIPGPLYRKLKAQAAANGRSVRELLLAGVKSVLLQSQRRNSKRVQFPLIVSDGPKVDLTNEQIYEHVEFP
jgi:hypothetical protein